MSTPPLLPTRHTCPVKVTAQQWLLYSSFLKEQKGIKRIDACILSYTKHHTRSPSFLHLTGIHPAGLWPCHSSDTSLTKNTHFAGFRGTLAHTVPLRPQATPSHLHTGSWLTALCWSLSSTPSRPILPQGDPRILHPELQIGVSGAKWP